MGEEISRLMDGEFGDDDFDTVYGQLKHPDRVAEWACYHVIGDTLRGSARVTEGFSKRFAVRLAAEPTVLAPQPGRKNRPLAYAWAAAAGVAAVALVGWVAFGTPDAQTPVMAKASEAATVRPAAVRRDTPVPADYLLAHQEFSPSTQIQGIGPTLRAASAPGPDVRP